MFFQLRVLEHRPVQFRQIMFCISANMTSATHVPRLTGGDAGMTAMSTTGKRKDSSEERCVRQDQLRTPVGGKGTAGAMSGAKA